jgi:predicted alpha/beta superfamily hydrolase
MLDARPAAMHVLGPYDVSGVAGPPRRVRVWIPRGHDPVARPQPILVLFDGQNVFDDDGSYAGGWHAHETVDALSRRTCFRPIVVAIDHGGERRIEELGSFAQHGEAGAAGRRGITDRLLTWIGEALVPEIRVRFGGWPGPIGTAIAGSSMGGLAALYAHFRRPDLFGGVIAMSPSLWYRARALFRFIERAPNPPVSRIYLDCGAREGGGRMVALVEQLADALLHRGYNEPSLLVRIDPRGTHSERHWRRRLPRALRFMYRR